MPRVRLTGAVAALFIAAVATTATAQAPLADAKPWSWSANAGLSQWDLSGTGWSPLVALRLDRQLGVRALLLEGSVGAFQPKEQSGTHRYLTTEAQLQLQLPRAVAPYLGLGGGAFDRLGSDPGSGPTLTASIAGGVRLWQVVPGSVLRAELRVRGIGPSFGGAVAEWTVGYGRSF